MHRGLLADGGGERPQTPKPRGARPGASDSDNCQRAGTLSGVVTTTARCMPATLTDTKKSATRIPVVLRQHERLPTPCTKLVRISGAAQWRFPAPGAPVP